VLAYRTISVYILHRSDMWQTYFKTLDVFESVISEEMKSSASWQYVDGSTSCERNRVLSAIV